MVGALLAALAFLVRWVTDTDLGRDATLYLWTAGQVLDGRFEALWQSVFHPLHPAVVALVGSATPDVPLETVGRWVASIAGSLAAWPLYLLGKRVVGTSGAVWGALLYGIGSWFARTPVEAMSEGLYWLCICSGLLLAGWGSVGRAALGGVVLGLGYGVHPNAAAVLATVPLCRWWWGEGAAARAVITSGGAVVLLLVLGWWIWGPGPVLSSKLAFVWGEGVGSAPSAFGHVGRHILGLPGAALEGVGPVAFPLAVLGLLCPRLWRSIRAEESPAPTPAGRPQLLWLPFVLLLVPIALLKAHHRFLTAHGILLLPFAGAALHGVLRWLQDSLDGPTAARQLVTGRRLGWLLVLLVVGSELVRWEIGGPSKPYERDLGAALLARLEGGAPTDRAVYPGAPALVTDMPRVAFFAGVEPGPPKHRPQAEFLAAALRAETRWVAFRPKRSGPIGQDLKAAGFRFVALGRLLPRGEANSLAALRSRGVEVYIRR